MRRREWIKSAAATVAASSVADSVHGDVPDHLWQGYDFGPGPKPVDQLNQGPFGIEQDDGSIR